MFYLASEAQIVLFYITSLYKCCPKPIEMVLCILYNNATYLLLLLQTQSMYAGMCPGLREWWLQNGVLNFHNLVIFNIYTPTVSRIPCRHFVLCKVAGITKHLHSY